MPTGIAKEIDVVRDVNLKILPPLSLSAETTDGMRELTLASLFTSTTDDDVTNTTTETNFAPTGVGSKVLAAESMKVGDVFHVIATGILSTV